MTVYEKYYQNSGNKALQFGLYGYSPPTDGTYRVDGEIKTTGEDYRTVERYREYKEVGFNILLMQHTSRYSGEEWETSDAKMVMDRAQEAGLTKAIVNDKRIWDLCREEDGILGEGKPFADESALDGFLADCVAPYKTHPIFYGIQLLDEPRKKQLKGIGQIYKSLKRVCPTAFVQCNLLPLSGIPIAENAFPGEGNFTDKFKAYLEMFLDETGAEYILYDSYPICEQWWESNIGRFYIKGLQIASKVCKERGVEFRFIAQTFGMTNAGYRYFFMPNEAQIRWQINLLLGFGVKELAYFTYWTKQDNNTKGELFHDGEAMMTRDGKRTETYYTVQKINREIEKLAPVILNFEYVANRYAIKTPLTSHPLFLEYTEREVLEGVTVTTSQEVAFVQELKDRKNGQPMYVITNATDPKYAEKYETPQTTVLDFNGKYTKADVYEMGEWKTVLLIEGKYEANLRPGYAQFILPY